jgi:prepilin-type N-terminal cleavage/methylation domain-containing protein
MDLFHKKNSRGYTLIELLVVISIFGTLSVIVMSSLTAARLRARDVKIRLDVRQIINALYLAREDTPNGLFPGDSTTWQCLKAAGVCWQTTFSGNPAVTSALAPYMPTIPTPPNPPFNSSTYLYNSYMYIPNYTGCFGPATDPSPSRCRGTFLVWAQSVPINDCQGYYAGNLDGNYYCYQRIAEL